PREPLPAPRARARGASRAPVIRGLGRLLRPGRAVLRVRGGRRDPRRGIRPPVAAAGVAASRRRGRRQAGRRARAGRVGGRAESRASRRGAASRRHRTRASEPLSRRAPERGARPVTAAAALALAGSVSALFAGVYSAWSP